MKYLSRGLKNSMLLLCIGILSWLNTLKIKIYSVFYNKHKKSHLFTETYRIYGFISG